MKLSYRLGVALALGLTPVMSSASTYLWTGNAGEQDGAYDWMAPANWDVGSGYPSVGDEACFRVTGSDITVAVTGEVSVARLRATPGTTKKVTLMGTGSLAITGGASNHREDAILGNATGTTDQTYITGISAAFDIRVPVTFSNTTASTLYWHAGEIVRTNLALRCGSNCTLELLRYKLADETFTGPECRVDLTNAVVLKVAATTPLDTSCNHRYGNVSIYVKDGARLLLPQTERYFDSSLQQEDAASCTTVRDELKIARKNSSLKVMGGVFEVTGETGRIYTHEQDNPTFAISGGKVIAHSIVNKTVGGNSTITGGTLKIADLNTTGTHAVSVSGNVTIDLTDDEAVTAIGSVAFANARVTLDVGTRTFESDTTLLTWSAAPSGVEFAVTGDNVENAVLIPSASGLVCRVPQSTDQIVKTAVWTGAANDGNPTNVLNWTCRNANGDVITDEPMFVSDSLLTIAGSVFVNLPPTITLQGVLSIGSCSLTADCDWSGYPFTSIVVADSTIDLCGHDLRVATAVGATVDTARTFTDTVGHGRLRMLVASGYFVNGGAAMTGGLCLVKEGAGTLLGKKTGQDYTGGTIVSNGTLAVFNATEDSTTYSIKKLPFGVANSTIFLARDAHFNIIGNYDGYTYRLVSDGGVIESNNSPERPSGWFQQLHPAWSGLGDITLTADSTYNPRFNMIQSSGTVDLGGHILTIGEYGDKILYWKSAITNGTIITKVRANTNVNQGYGFYLNGAVDARTVDFVVQGSLAVNHEFCVRDYTADYNRNDNYGNGEMKVYGTFTPGAHDYFYGCTLEDGSAIDFSKRASALPAASAFTTGRKALGFASGARITVRLGDRMAEPGTKLMAWSTRPAATFVSESAMVALGLKAVAREDGLYLVRGAGLAIIVR